jgi:hypothetical protein
MINSGILDPLKVVKTALVDASGVASLLSTSECVIVVRRFSEEIPFDKSLVMFSDRLVDVGGSRGQGTASDAGWWWYGRYGRYGRYGLLRRILHSLEVRTATGDGVAPCLCTVDLPLFISPTTYNAPLLFFLGIYARYIHHPSSPLPAPSFHFSHQQKMESITAHASIK